MVEGEYCIFSIFKEQSAVAGVKIGMLAINIKTGGFTFFVNI